MQLDTRSLQLCTPTDRIRDNRALIMRQYIRGWGWGRASTGPPTRHALMHCVIIQAASTTDPGSATPTTTCIHRSLSLSLSLSVSVCLSAAVFSHLCLPVIADTDRQTHRQTDEHRYAETNLVMGRPVTYVAEITTLNCAIPSNHRARCLLDVFESQTSRRHLLHAPWSQHDVCQVTGSGHARHTSIKAAIVTQLHVTDVI